MSWLSAIPLLSGVLSFFGGERRNRQQVASAREQMQFQERMSSTAHQRQVADLRAAGLNPILSSRYGGASSPGGAQAQLTDTISPAVSTALGARRMNEEIKQMQANVDNTRETNKNIREQRKVIAMQAKELEARVVNLNMNSAKASTAMNVDQAQTAYLQEQAASASEQRKIMPLQRMELDRRTRMMQTQLEGLLEEEKIDKSTYGKIMRWLGRMNPLSSSARNIMTPLKR